MKQLSAPTLQDVAREAGVSAMTASAVLNGTRSATRVSETTRARVEEIAARLRYRPNAVARGLSRRRMDTLGVVSIVDSSEINLYFLEILNGILTAAAEQKQNITVFSVSDWAQDEQTVLQCCDGRVDGMLFIAPHLTASFAQTLALHMPFVTIHAAEPLGNAPNIDVDNEGGAFAAVQHLIAQGHRRIAHLTGDLRLFGGRQRLAGYHRALAVAGLSADEALVRIGGFTIDAGRQGMTALLAQPGPRPTAVFCANDALAYGAIEILTGQEVRVPEAMSVIGFDDLMLARMTHPYLTTMRQPFRSMAQRAVELLLERVASGSEAVLRPSHEVFQTELILRGSTKPLRV